MLFTSVIISCLRQTFKNMSVSFWLLGLVTMYESPKSLIYRSLIPENVCPISDKNILCCRHAGSYQNRSRLYLLPRLVHSNSKCRSDFSSLSFIYGRIGQSHTMAGIFASCIASSVLNLSYVDDVFGSSILHSFSHQRLSGSFERRI